MCWKFHTSENSRKVYCTVTVHQASERMLSGLFLFYVKFGFVFKLFFKWEKKKKRVAETLQKD